MNNLETAAMIEYILNNPQRATIGSITSFVAGSVPNIDRCIQDDITFYFQIVAFSVSIIVGLFAIHGYICKNQDRKRQNHEH
jgi:uncharacterized membrane protein